MFNLPLKDSRKFISKLSKQYRELEFKLFYAEKLLSKAKIITYLNNKSVVLEQDLNLTLQEMMQPLQFEKAFKGLI